MRGWRVETRAETFSINISKRLRIWWTKAGIWRGIVFPQLPIPISGDRKTNWALWNRYFSGSNQLCLAQSLKGKNMAASGSPSRMGQAIPGERRLSRYPPKHIQNTLLSLHYEHILNIKVQLPHVRIQIHIHTYPLTYAVWWETMQRNGWTIHSTHWSHRSSIQF